MNIDIARLRRGAGVLLMAAGVNALAWVGLVKARAAYVTWETIRLPAVSAVGDERTTAEATIRAGAPIGTIEIPRLRLATVVVEGDDATSLAVGAGHLPDTPFPWEPGNSAVAGHRDAEFRRLQSIRPGDVIRFTAADRELTYVVREMRVVDPTDLSVLEKTERPALTLVTCYPFHYIGPAPKRFVVRAESED
jgi:sortase A